MSGPAPEASALARGRVHARLLLALAVLATSVALGVSLPIESGPGAKTPGPWIVVILARLAYRGHAWAVHAFRVLCLVGALLSGAEGISLFSRVPGSSVLLMVSAAVLLAVGLALFAAQEVSAFLTEQRAAHMGSALGQLEARVLHAGDRTAVAAGRGARAAGHAAQQLSGWLSSFPARFAAFRSAAAVRLYVGALIVHPT